MTDRWNHPLKPRNPFRGLRFLLDEKSLLVLILVVSAIGCVLGFALGGSPQAIG